MVTSLKLMGPPSGTIFAKSVDSCVAHMGCGALIDRFSAGSAGPPGPGGAGIAGSPGPAGAGASESLDALVSTEPSGSGPAQPTAAIAPSAIITCSVPRVPRVIVASGGDLSTEGRSLSTANCVYASRNLADARPGGNDGLHVAGRAGQRAGIRIGN